MYITSSQSRQSVSTKIVQDLKAIPYHRNRSFVFFQPAEFWDSEMQMKIIGYHTAQNDAKAGKSVRVTKTIP
jgi:BRCT domain type II-containing protein